MKKMRINSKTPVSSRQNENNIMSPKNILHFVLQNIFSSVLLVSLSGLLQKEGRAAE